MKSDIFMMEMEKFNKEMKLENRKALLFVDNCSAHPKMELSNVQIVFLPPDTTAGLQPLDMGIIRSLKSGYRRQLVHKLIELLDNKMDWNANKINLLDAIYVINRAWDEVSS